MVDDALLVERTRQLDRLCRHVAVQAEGLGFTLDDVIDALSEERHARRTAP